MPCQNQIAAFWKRVGRPARTALGTGVICGVLAYLFALTNTLFLTGDALNNIYFDGNLMWIGRWSSQWLSSLSTSYTMPYINGMIAILAVAVLSALLVSVFEIRSSVLATASAILMTCFPTVSATLGYMHNADAYLLAAMLAALGVFLLEKYRWGLFPAVVVIAFATGTYQASATFALGMMFVRGMQLLICDRAVDGRGLLRRAGRYALCMVFSVGLYYIVLLAMTGGTGSGVGDYQSVTRSASLDTLLAFPENLAGCYRDFWQAMGALSTEEGCQVGNWPNVIFMVAVAALMCACFVAYQGKNPWRFVAMLALAALAPFFLCAIRIFAPEKVYVLMTYSVSGIYLLGIVLMDRLDGVMKRAREARKQCARLALAGLSWVMMGCLMLCAFVWTIDANVKFHKAKLDYENMYAQCATYLALAEANENYVQGMPVLVIGDSSYASDRAQPIMYETKMYYTFMKYILKMNMPFDTANGIRDLARGIAETEDFILMPCYPQEGSVQAIENCIVVKLSEMVY